MMYTPDPNAPIDMSKLSELYDGGGRPKMFTWENLHDSLLYIALSFVIALIIAAIIVWAQRERRFEARDKSTIRRRKRNAVIASLILVPVVTSFFGLRGILNTYENKIDSMEITSRGYQVSEWAEARYGIDLAESEAEELLVDSRMIAYCNYDRPCYQTVVTKDGTPVTSLTVDYKMTIVNLDETISEHPKTAEGASK